MAFVRFGVPLSPYSEPIDVDQRGTSSSEYVFPGALWRKPVGHYINKLLAEHASDGSDKEMPVLRALAAQQILEQCDARGRQWLADCKAEPVEDVHHRPGVVLPVSSMDCHDDDDYLDSNGSDADVSECGSSADTVLDGGARGGEDDDISDDESDSGWDAYRRGVAAYRRQIAEAEEARLTEVKLDQRKRCRDAAEARLAEQQRQTAFENKRRRQLHAAESRRRLATVAPAAATTAAATSSG